MGTEFTSKGYVSDSWTCFIHNCKRFSLKSFVISNVKKITSKKNKDAFEIKQRYTNKAAQKVILDQKLAIADGKPSWFYTAFDRKSSDPLTNYTLQFIENNLQKEAKILISGCGTGITVFHLADCGFKDIVGTDLLPECIGIANQLKKDFKYDNTRFVLDDGFAPTINEKFDMITALHWVFSAWMGNYGNSAILNPFDKQVREDALDDFFEKYSKLLNVNGMLIIELIDAVTDYRLASDHKKGEYSLKMYPIRHSPEQVQKVAKKNGLVVVDKKLSVSYGNHPRVAYYLKKES